MRRYFSVVFRSKTNVPGTGTCTGVPRPLPHGEGCSSSRVAVGPSLAGAHDATPSPHRARFAPPPGEAPLRGVCMFIIVFVNAFSAGEPGYIVRHWFARIVRFGGVRWRARVCPHTRSATPAHTCTPRAAPLPPAQARPAPPPHGATRAAAARHVGCRMYFVVIITVCVVSAHCRCSSNTH